MNEYILTSQIPTNLNGQVLILNAFMTLTHASDRNAHLNDCSKQIFFKKQTVNL